MDVDCFVLLFEWKLLRLLVVGLEIYRRGRLSLGRV